MVSYLDLLPVDWTLLKKSKIGKAVNSALKAQLFEQAVLDKTSAVVTRWKLMVKELKSAGASAEPANNKSENYNNIKNNPEKQQTDY